MYNEQIQNLKPKIQQIIDLIVTKNTINATLLLSEVNDEIEELIDLTAENEGLIELSKYQMLLKHLQNKIKNEQ
ncbi:MAG: hypothetical protein A3G95_08300 [Flavobacteria bacterium RIFCSPLOWO2_12_FULL_31_7]|jgi:hypothetical protein|nr:MAG: hypothetical protein A3G95_08300 [Flavobacteria bacterium RIFCSPLOWO2_12_FULL_31_7]